MTKTLEVPEVNTGRILEIFAAIAPKPSVFEAPLGIDDQCLSAEDLVSILYQGVRGTRATHLMSCSTCAENVRNLQSVLSQSKKDFVGRALNKEVSEEGDDLFKEGFLPVILAIPDKTIGVATEPEHAPFVFTCGMFPLASGFDEIDGSSLQASGAILTKGTPEIEYVDLNEDGKADFIKLTFAEGQLAARVREAVSRHQNVVDTVQIEGVTFPQKTKKRIVGLARVEFANKTDLSF